MHQSKLFVSILAGITLKQLEHVLSEFGGRIIRVMPNTPMTVGEGRFLYITHQIQILLLHFFVSVKNSFEEINKNLGYVNLW